MLNKSGSKTEAWGASNSIPILSLKFLLILIHWVRFDKYKYINCNYKSETLGSFGKSVKKAPNVLPLSTDSLNFSVITKKLCSELYPQQNPHWLGKFLSLKYQ